MIWVFFIIGTLILLAGVGIARYVISNEKPSAKYSIINNNRLYQGIIMICFPTLVLSRLTARPTALLAVLLATLLLASSPALAQSPPAAVGSVTLTRADGSVTANWNAVAGATKYHVTYSTDDGQSWHAPVNDHTNVPTNTLTFSADNTKTYIVGVRAGNDHGWSGWVNSPASGPYTPPTGTDYDTDDDSLIEISSVAQLDAIRYDLDGNGSVSAGDLSTYQAAYPNAANNMGCPTGGCTGYELSTGLDLSGRNWTPIGGYNATFDGNDLTISNLYINLPTTGKVGLFGKVATNGVVRNVVLSSVDVTGDDYVGGLVGSNDGTITGSSSSGSVTASHYVGGLVGSNDGSITDSGSSGKVTAEEYVGGLVGSNDGPITNSTSSADVTAEEYVGGLVGSNSGNSDNGGTITDSGSSGKVTAEEYVGGLVGSNGGPITNSTSSADVTASHYVGGLVGNNEGTITGSTSSGGVTASHYVGGLVGSNDGSITDSNASSNVTAFKHFGALVGSDNGTITNSQGTGTLTQLPGVALASANYAGLVSWQYELASGVAFSYMQVRWMEKPANGGNPDWGSASKYLTYDASATSYQITGLTYDKVYLVKLFMGLSEDGAFRLVKTDPVEFTATDGKDFDADDDGLIDVSSMAQLSAMRYDTDGNGSVSDDDLSNYQAAYPDPMDNMGCPSSGCVGYELTKSLIPWGSSSTPINGYNAIFDGNGFTIIGLRISAGSQNYVGLFGSVGSSGVIRNLSLGYFNVTGKDYVGALVGDNSGTVTDVFIYYPYANGKVSGEDYVGALVGRNSGTVSNSWAHDVPVSGSEYVGGLVGSNSGTIQNSSADGDVDGFDYLGALTGSNTGTITNSSGTGTVTLLPLGRASASVTDAGLVSWSYRLKDGVSFSYVQVRWIEKPDSGPPNWGNANKHLIWDANASSYQITGLTSGTEYVVRLFFGLSQNGFKQLKVDAGTFTAPTSGSSLSLSASRAGVGTVFGADAASAPRLPGYVSNLSSAPSGGTQMEAGDLAAVAFTTGPNPGGYTLNSVTATLGQVSGEANLVLTLHEMESDTYGEDSKPAPTARATLTGTAPTSDEFTDLTHTCSGSGCALAPDTTYFVVAESLGPGVFSWAFIFSSASLSETTAPANSGWSLGYGHYSADAVTWSSFQDWQHLRVDFTPRATSSAPEGLGIRG